MAEEETPSRSSPSENDSNIGGTISCSAAAKGIDDESSPPDIVEQQRPSTNEERTVEQEDEADDSYSTDSISSTSSNDDDDDDDDDDESWFDTLQSSWRQHCLAVAVAVVLAYYYQQQLSTITMHQHSSSSITRKAAGRRSLQHVATPTPDPADSSSPADAYDENDPRNNAHPHLRDYQRTSNITFCSGPPWTPDNDSNNSNNNNNEGGLELMDFHVPKDLLDVMKLHFQADLLQDDNYEHSMVYSNSDSLEQQHHPEIDCMNELSQTSSSKSFIKGVTYFYRAPSIESMYYRSPQRGHEVASVKTKAPAITEAIQLSFPGFVAKFINLTPQPVLLHWEDGRSSQRRLVGELAPYEALTTATRPGEAFFVSPVYDPSDALERWTVTPEDSTVYYETGKKSNNNQHSLTAEQELQYKMQKLNQEFAMHYLIHSGRRWLSHFPRRFPVHPMWSADYFGQTHTVPTFRVDEHDAERPTTLTLEVVSVTPRVFTIRNFMTRLECETLQQMALHQGMKGSTLYAGSLAQQQRDLSTRSSSNAWLARRTANITDRLYRRSAHVLQLDERLLQADFMGDDWEHDAHQNSVAESLQVIRYRRGEEYAPHHDWVLSGQRNRHQPTRWATLLLYLNDDFEGGRTVFPRAVNAQNHDGISIAPEQGMAVLFYNMLPDGNVDDLSQHGSEPVTEGEKVSLVVE